MSSSLSRFSGCLRSLSLGEGLTDLTGARDGTRADGVLDRGRRRLFLFGVLPGGAVELPGRSRPAPGVVDLRRGGSMSSSLSRFSGWRSRSLSLGEGLTDSTGARDGTRGCVGSRAAPAFLFSFCLAAPSSYRVDRGRHLGCRPSLGGSMSSSLSRFSGWRSRSLSLGEGLTDFDRRSGWHPRGVLDRGRRRLFSFCILPGGAVELPGRSRPAPGVSTFAGGLNVELSLPIFRLALAVFIPWRGADGFDRRSGWHPRVCWIEGGAGFSF